jgi:16S rRNA (guanine527-N7)-methyltransferase
LAIVMPDVQFTLVEATGKKAKFLEQTAQALDLHNVTIVNERAETLGRDHHPGGHREQYDAVIARAVGKLPVLLELTVPLAKIGGHVLAMKGERAAEEIAEAKQALHLLHAHVVDSHQTPTGTIVVIEKQRKTPRTYPRLPGEPKRSPLG